MEDRQIDIWSMFWRRLFAMIRTKVVIALVLFGMLLLGIAIDNFAPSPKMDATTFAEIQKQAIDRARAEGYTSPANFMPYNNRAVLNYVVPLFGVWMLCRFARFRRRLPTAVIATLVLLLAGLWLTWTAGEMIAGMYDGDWMSDKNRVKTWILVAVMAVVIPVFSFRWLWRGPGWIDSILRGGGGPGGDAANGYSATWARIWLYVTLAAGAPGLWWLYDNFDGAQVPSAFGLSARAVCVVLGLWLMTGAQFRLSWPGDGPEIEEVPEDAIDVLLDS